MTTDTEVAKPWFQQKWLLFVIAIPASSVVMGIVIITLAFQQPVSLVRDNYYKDGLTTTELFHLGQAAQDRGITGELTLTKSSQLLSLTLTGDAVDIDHLRLAFIHPTLPERDKTVILTKTEGLTFNGLLDTELTGRYYLQLSDLDNLWQIKTVAFMPPQQVVSLAPQLPN